MDAWFGLKSRKRAAREYFKKSNRVVRSGAGQCGGDERLTDPQRASVSH
jgi:hypothetical protein